MTWGAESMGSMVLSMYYVCMNVGARTWARMGSCMRCCWAGLLCCRGTTLCRGGGALGIGGAMVCAEALNCVGRTMCDCVHLCTQGALGRTGSATLTARPTGPRWPVTIGEATNLFGRFRSSRAGYLFCPLPLLIPIVADWPLRGLGMSY